MVSSTHEDGQIVVSKETTPVYPSENTYDLNKYDVAESSSSKGPALSKNEEQMKSYVQLDDNDVKGKGVAAEDLSSVNEKDLSVEATVLDENKELCQRTQIQVNICDTCGDLGENGSLVTCDICKVGAEHMYCMRVKIKKRPVEWRCYDCTEDGAAIRERKAMKRKSESLIGFLKLAEKTSPGERIDLNVDPNLDLNVDPNLDLNADPNVDMNVEPNSKKRKTNSFIDFFKMSEERSQRQLDLLGLDLNKDPNIDLNADLDIDLNVDPNINMDMGLNLSLS